MNDSHETTFEEALEDTDFGFIVCGKTGRLKGLWIPIEMNDQPVPENIIHMCAEYFDIDPSEFDEELEEETSNGKTIH
jgi:hypothetical protein